MVFQCETENGFEFLFNYGSIKYFLIKQEKKGRENSRHERYLSPNPAKWAEAQRGGAIFPANKKIKRLRGLYVQHSRNYRRHKQEVCFLF